MAKFYFTFGQSHMHNHSGKILDRDSVVEITAKDSEAARKIMFSNFDRKWAFQYTEADIDMSYFPQGVVLKLEEE